MKFSPDQCRAAVAQHATVFFDADLTPIEPIVGQWFCEFDAYDGASGTESMRDEAMVEFLGMHAGRPMVAEEGDEAEERRPRGIVLIRQGA